MGIRSPGISIKIPENRFFFSHMSKEPISNLLLSSSPPTKTDEAFEKELDRSRKEFNQFNQDLDEIAHSMEKLFEDAPEWLANIEEIKRKQDSVEECILATQEKIFESENHLEKLKSLQNEVTEDINNDLKKIQEQIFDILEKHRSARSNVTNIYNNQSKTSEQLDLMLQAIHEYARLIREASLTIKHFDDVGSPLKYESLDLSPFRHYKGISSYFEDHIHQVSTPESESPVSHISPMIDSPELPSASTTTTHTSATTPTSLDTHSSDQSPLSLKDPQPSHPPIHPLPSYQIKHQKLLLLSMRRAAVGLKFLLYANQLNDYKNECPDSDCDLDLDLFDDTSTEEVVTTTYRDIIPDCKVSSSKSSISSTGICESNCDSNNCDSGGNDYEKNKECTPSKICVTIHKRSLVVHSYNLLRFDKRMLVKQQG
ncbi:hypothetical protein C1645_734678 [Glomus cerebriforme]|uniref:Uncharacterized protein n=1 Tax=Glomus cerebriforme TaxID=658196 RepID=A0A397T8P8_9GLOM|nr:hypothetical protein C1645_734678 [Glomus cerebriforme]